MGRRFFLVTWFFSALSLVCQPVMGYDRYGGYPDYAAEMARKNDKGSKFGLVSAGAVSGAFGFVIGQVYYRRRNRVIKKRHEREVEAMVKRHKDEKDRLAKAFREEMQELQYMLGQSELVIQQLQNALYNTDLDVGKRKFAEFKLPDANNDDIISRTEFNSYLKSYLALHPEFSEVDYPTFDDFDMNKDGVVTFAEWKKYIAKLEEEQARTQQPSPTASSGKIGAQQPAYYEQYRR